MAPPSSTAWSLPAPTLAVGPFVRGSSHTLAATPPAPLLQRVIPPDSNQPRCRPWLFISANATVFAALIRISTPAKFFRASAVHLFRCGPPEILVQRRTRVRLLLGAIRLSGSRPSSSSPSSSRPDEQASLHPPLLSSPPLICFDTVLVRASIAAHTSACAAHAACLPYMKIHRATIVMFVQSPPSISLETRRFSLLIWQV